MLKGAQTSAPDVPEEVNPGGNEIQFVDLMTYVNGRLTPGN